MEDVVIVDQAAGIASITLNRPAVRNALNEELCDSLRRAITDVSADDSCRLVILEGAGGHFCAGADVSDPSALLLDEGDGAEPWFRQAAHAVVSLFEMPKITVAKVQGAAVGAGMNLALACDLVVAGRSARFSEIFARRGMSLDFGGSWLLPRIVGLQAAKRLALCADMLSADEAAALGLVGLVVEDEELDGAVGELATRLATGPTVALVNAKRLLNSAFQTELRAAVDAEIDAQMVNLRTADLAEALRAFRERRDPLFTGR